MKKSDILMFGILLLVIILAWMMFQPLMSAYAEEVFESGEIYVYGIGFLTGFGIQGVLTVVSPFLLLFILFINVRKKLKTQIWLVLIIANVLAYTKTWLNAKEWLVTAVSPEIQYYVCAVIYPCMMAITAGLVLWWIYRYDIEEFAEE